ncbi:hypothetical protein NA57DRAFT_77002 [Rhizodiscina lignyota]|uniref:Uncharacterized protein n=1 Tax=Rhizodiscina lignyota TaxID=1504668 RepID=A0A9P4IFL2_9PEZI|nr:hypothetical protein NA57DRAFT_77002 [Rhizodiscina lignyota]
MTNATLDAFSTFITQHYLNQYTTTTMFLIQKLEETLEQARRPDSAQEHYMELLSVIDKRLELATSAMNQQHNLTAKAVQGLAKLAQGLTKVVPIVETLVFLVATLIVFVFVFFVLGYDFHKKGSLTASDAAALDKLHKKMEKETKDSQSADMAELIHEFGAILNHRHT